MRFNANARMTLSTMQAWGDGRVPVGPHDLRMLALIHHERPDTSGLFLRAAQALASGARSAAGRYYDLAAATLGVEHHTEASTAPCFADVGAVSDVQ